MDLTDYEKQQLRAMLRDRDSDAYQRGYRAGQEDAAKAQCQGCRLGWKMTNGGHLMPTGGGYSQCQAEPIRALVRNGHEETNDG